MPGLGRKVFTVSEVLTAANVNGYLMDQTVMVFAGTAARASAIGTPSEGMVSYLVDGTGSQAVEYYNGSAWTSLVPAASSSTVTNVSAAYTVTAADANDTLLANGTAAYTITFPDLFAINDRIDIVRDGSGTVTLAAGTGITTWAGAGTAGTAVAFKMDQQYNAATVLKVAANSYRVIGKITV
jgi:hypothetical protein